MYILRSLKYYKFIKILFVTVEQSTIANAKRPLLMDLYSGTTRLREAIDDRNTYASPSDVVDAFIEDVKVLFVVLLKIKNIRCSKFL